ncbi:MAG: MCE family protein [Candidatus Acidiferrales bacterium]
MEEIAIRISRRTARAAGIILSVICLALISSYVWSSGLLLPKYRLSIYLPEASELNSGAPVRLDGIEIGVVQSIDVARQSSNNDRRIEVHLRILKRYQNDIRNDSTATLATEGLLGGRYVNVTRGFNGTPIEPGGEIDVPPTFEVSYKGILDLIAKAATCLQEEKRSSQDKSKAPLK